MKLLQLSHVIAVADRGGIRAAARSQGLSQPALTRSISDLESELGGPLFERRARGMKLTQMGEAFYRRATSIVEDVRRAKDESAQICGRTSGKVTLGLSFAAHVALLPKALPNFRKRYPDVQMHIIAAQLPALEAKLLDGSVDFFIGPEQEQALSSELFLERMFQNTRIIIGRRGHPLAQSKSLKDLVAAEWATTSVTINADEELGTLFTDHSLAAPTLVLQSQSALTLAVALTNSNLLAMVPKQWIEFPPFAEYLITIPVKERLRAPPIIAVRRREMPLTPAAQYLLDMLWRNVPRNRSKL